MEITAWMVSNIMETTTNAVTGRLDKSFPFLLGNHNRQLREIFERAKLLSFPANQQVSSPGTACEFFMMVLSGSIRVQVLTDSGREVTLYYVRPGDGCILTTSCLLSHEPFPAEGITEADTEVLALTRAEFDQSLGSSSEFRHLVFSNVGQRLADVIIRLEQLCSPSIDRHLAKSLLRMAENTDHKTIIITHQELANELGTAREVVSRHLKHFEQNDWVRLGRGAIQIMEPDVLGHLAMK